MQFIAYTFRCSEAHGAIRPHRLTRLWRPAARAASCHSAADLFPRLSPVVASKPEGNLLRSGVAVGGEFWTSARMRPRSATSGSTWRGGLDRRIPIGDVGAGLTLSIWLGPGETWNGRTF